MAIEPHGARRSTSDQETDLFGPNQDFPFSMRSMSRNPNHAPIGPEVREPGQERSGRDPSGRDETDWSNMRGAGSGMSFSSPRSPIKYPKPRCVFCHDRIHEWQIRIKANDGLMHFSCSRKRKNQEARM